ncbi:MAG: M20/M25/M40 family metallo-hydrolase [Actinomycetota bacterium]|nr:M20/M25/M40 family metallo-hydrolase [Actinomycetota bacterium]
MPKTLESATALLPRMIEAVQLLVRIESPTHDLAACANIAEIAADLTGEWLGSPARVEVHDGCPVLRWGPEHPQVLLLGHLDTVWPVGTLDRLPTKFADDQLTGPGVFDMKAGVVQALAAVALLIAEGTDVSAVGLLLTTDEETGSRASRGVISAAITEAKAVLVFEPSAGGALKTERKGTSWYQIKFHGRAAHAGLDPERGVNATVEAAAFVIATQTWGDQGAGTTVTPTLLHSGTTANTVPVLAESTLDVRAWTAAEQQRIDENVRAWRVSHPEARIEIDGGIDRPPLEAAASLGLFAIAQNVAQELGLPELKSCAVGGASDGNLTAAAGVATLDGLGAVGDGAHADHEWALASAMAERAALTAGIIKATLYGEVND